MYVVFYAHPDDAKLAELLADYLDFGDRTPVQSIRQLVEGAPDVRQAVKNAYDQTEILIVLISPAWLRSVGVDRYNSGAVENVILKAFLNRDKPIIPILLRGVKQVRVMDLHGEIDRLADLQTVPLNLEDTLATIQAIVKGTLLTGKSVMADSTRALSDTVGLPPVVLPQQPSTSADPEREHGPLRRVFVMTLSIVVLLFVAYGAYLVGRNEGDDDSESEIVATQTVAPTATEADFEGLVETAIAVTDIARTATALARPTDTALPTVTVTPTDTATPTVAPTDTVPPTVTASFTPSATLTPSVTLEPTATQTATATQTPPPTDTPAPTPTEIAAVMGDPVVALDALTAATIGDVTQLGEVGRGAIVNGALSADGRRFAAGTFAAVWLYDLRADLAEAIATFVHGGPITASAMSAGGDMVATGGFDRVVRIWNADTGAMITDFSEHDGSVNAITFSADGTLVASAAEDIFLYAPTPQASVRTFAAHRDRVAVLAFSPDGSRLASGDVGGRVIIWDVATGTIDAELAHTATITDLQFAPNNALILTSTDEGVTRYWDIAAQAELGSLSPAASGATWFENRPLAVRLDDDPQATLLDISNGDVLVQWQAIGPLKHAYFSPQGQAILVTPDDVLFSLFDFTQPFISEVIPDHQLKTTRIAASPDGQFMLAGTTTGAVVLFRPDDQDVFAWLQSLEDPIISVAVGDTVGGGITQNGTVLLYAPIQSPDLERVIPIDTIPSARDMAFFGDSVAVASGGGVFVLDGRTGETTIFISGPPLTSLAWSPRGDAIVASGTDGTIYVWDAATGEQRFAEDQSGRDILSVAWSSNDLIAAAGRDMNVVLRDAQSGTVVATLDVGFVVDAVAFSPNGALLAVAPENPAGTLVVFTVATGDRTEISGHVGLLYDVAWGVDGGRLFSTGQDATLRVWGLP